MIVIYSKDNCPYCLRAIRLAEEKGFKHTIFKIGDNITQDDFLNKFPNARTVPQIENIVSEGNEYIGGYTEFESWVLSKALGGMTL
jgi:glutaredoxin